MADSGLKMAHVSVKQDAYSTRFQNLFVVGRNRVRGNYGLSLSGSELLRAVFNFEAPSLSLPILVL